MSTLKLKLQSLIKQKIQLKREKVPSSHCELWDWLNGLPPLPPLAWVIITIKSSTMIKTSLFTVHSPQSTFTVCHHKPVRGDQLSGFADEEIKRPHFCLDVKDKLKVIRPFFTVTPQNPPPWHTSALLIRETLISAPSCGKTNLDQRRTGATMSK